MIIYDLWLDKNRKVKVGLPVEADDFQDAGFEYIISIETDASASECASELSLLVELAQASVDKTLAVLEANRVALAVNVRRSNDVN